MDQGFFKNQIARLKKEYGEKAYGEERTNVLWGWAKKLSNSLFEMAVSEAIGNCGSAPMKSKLMETYQEVRNKHPEIKQYPDCTYCGSYGLVCDDKPLPTAYRCRCAAGQSLAGKVAEWPGELKRMVPTQSEINWRQADAIKGAIGQTFKKIDAVETSEGME